MSWYTPNSNVDPRIIEILELEAKRGQCGANSVVGELDVELVSVPQIEQVDLAVSICDELIEAATRIKEQVSKLHPMCPHCKTIGDADFLRRRECCDQWDDT